MRTPSGTWDPDIGAAAPTPVPAKHGCLPIRTSATQPSRERRNRHARTGGVCGRDVPLTFSGRDGFGEPAPTPVEIPAPVSRVILDLRAAARGDRVQRHGDHPVRMSLRVRQPERDTQDTPTRQRPEAVPRSQAGHPGFSGSGSSKPISRSGTIVLSEERRLASASERRSAPPPGCRGSPGPPLWNLHRQESHRDQIIRGEPVRLTGCSTRVEERAEVSGVRSPSRGWSATGMYPRTLTLRRRPPGTELGMTPPHSIPKHIAQQFVS